MLSNQVPELLYKFLPLRREDDITSYKGLLRSCIKGNLRFSSIHDLNDASENFISTNLSEMNSSLDSILKKGSLDKKQQNNLKKHVLLWKKFHPRTALTQKLVDSLLDVLPQLLSNPLLSRIENNVCSQIAMMTSMLQQNLQQKGVCIPDDFNVAGGISKFGKIGKSELFSIISDFALISVDDFFKKCGILSLSGNLYSFPMWAHYANNAKGFAIEYKNLDKHFKVDETGVLNKLKKVEYNNNRPSLTLDPSDLSEIFFNKLDDWKYELEYRVVRAFADCESVSTGNAQIYVHQVSCNYISKIIVGWNVCQEDFEQIAKIVHEDNSNISVVQAHIENGLICVE